MRPSSGQSRKEIPQLGQLYLGAGLPASRPTCEDIQDERRSIDDANVELRLDLERLCRGEIIIENNQLGPGAADLLAERLDLPSADEHRCIRPRAFHQHATHFPAPGGLDEAGKLLEVLGDLYPRATPELHPDEKRALRPTGFSWDRPIVQGHGEGAPGQGANEVGSEDLGNAFLDRLARDVPDHLVRNLACLQK